MIVAWIDPRPFIGIALLPIAAVAGFLLWRFAFRSSSWFICQIAAFALTLAAYQFIFYGPFIDQKRVVHVEAIATWRPDLGPDAIGFSFPKEFGFGGLISRDMDIAKRIREKGINPVDVAVELTYDFGRVRGMDLGYAYADGILFYPSTE